MPQTVDLRLALAQFYASQGKEPQVEALLIDLVRLKPNESAHRLRLAQYYARLNHIDEAERVLREAIKALPDFKTVNIKQRRLELVMNNEANNASALADS